MNFGLADVLIGYWVSSERTVALSSRRQEQDVRSKRTDSEVQAPKESTELPAPEDGRMKRDSQIQEA